jgi:hypothetical protein
MSSFRAVQRPNGIWEFHFQDFRRDTTDEWVKTALHDNQHYAATGQHLRQIYYIGKGVLPTPYATSQAVMLARTMPKHIRISTAILVPNTAIMTVARITVQRVPGTDYLRLFSTEQEAEHWLAQRELDLAVSV